MTGADEEALFTLADRNLVEMGADEMLALHQTLSALARTLTKPETINCHRDYYLALVDEDREDWQRIEVVYEQICFAWTQLPITDFNAVRFVDTLSTFQNRRNLEKERIIWLNVALGAAQHQQNQVSEARMFHELGYAYSALKEKQKALLYYQEALKLRCQICDTLGEAETRSSLGAIHRSLGNVKQAMDYHNEALSLRRQLGDKTGEATTLNNIGRIYSVSGDKQQALIHYQQALILRRKTGNKAGEATTLNNIGRIYSTFGDKQQALVYYKQALVLRRQLGIRRGERNTCYNMAKIYRSLGDLAEAEQLLQRTVELDEAIGHPDLTRDRAMLEQVRQERQAG